MKKIDRLLLKSFVGPFVLTLFITMFVFILQFFWKYIDDLVGKGLEVSIIAELTFYLSATIVPMVVPLAILLASIITFGNLGEHYELVALKSAGISLRRFMMPLFVLIVGFSALTFYFSNNVLPKANLKFSTLLYSVVKQRPAVNIKEGVFYDGINGFIIKIGRKDPDNITIYDVKIWDQTSGNPGENLLIAEKGKMYATPNDSFLVFKLYDGWKHEDLKPTPEKKKNYEHIRTAFQELELVIDLSNFSFEKKDEKIFNNNPRVMSITQLNEAIDTLEKQKERIPSDLRRQMLPFFRPPEDLEEEGLNLELMSCTDEPLVPLLALTKEERKQVLEKSKANTKSVQNYIKVQKDKYANNQKRKSRFSIYIHNKYSLAFSCIVLFLIGAPLGAIIRKGGLGLPMVMSIIFFMIFHVLNTIGRKLAEELVIMPVHGMWLAVYVLLPLAIFLTYKATNDSALFNLDAYTYFFKNLFSKKKKEA